MTKNFDELAHTPTVKKVDAEVNFGKFADI